MPVVISRLDEAVGDVSTYEIAIGDKRIALFSHIRSDGLPGLLRRAARAVEVISPLPRPLSGRMKRAWTRTKSKDGAAAMGQPTRKG